MDTTTNQSNERGMTLKPFIPVNPVYSIIHAPELFAPHGVVPPQIPPDIAGYFHHAANLHGYGGDQKLLSQLVNQALAAGRRLILLSDEPGTPLLAGGTRFDWHWNPNHTKSQQTITQLTDNVQLASDIVASAIESYGWAHAAGYNVFTFPVQVADAAGGVDAGQVSKIHGFTKAAKPHLHRHDVLNFSVALGAAGGSWSGAAGFARAFHQTTRCIVAAMVKASTINPSHEPRLTATVNIHGKWLSSPTHIPLPMDAVRGALCAILRWKRWNVGRELHPVLWAPSGVTTEALDLVVQYMRGELSDAPGDPGNPSGI